MTEIRQRSATLLCSEVPTTRLRLLVRHVLLAFIKPTRSGQPTLNLLFRCQPPSPERHRAFGFRLYSYIFRIPKEHACTQAEGGPGGDSHDIKLVKC